MRCGLFVFLYQEQGLERKFLITLISPEILDNSDGISLLNLYLYLYTRAIRVIILLMGIG